MLIDHVKLPLRKKMRPQSQPDSKTASTHSAPDDEMSAAETLQAAGLDLKAEAQSMLAIGRSRGSHLLQKGKARAAEWKGGFQDGIREKPFQSVLIAAAVGAVIGVLLGRRSR